MKIGGDGSCGNGKLRVDRDFLKEWNVVYFVGDKMYFSNKILEAFDWKYLYLRQCIIDELSFLVKRKYWKYLNWSIVFHLSQRMYSTQVNMFLQSFDITVILFSKQFYFPSPPN